MELQLKNIGMIKEANVKIDGLTVIAGENDTGKSTVGKALYLQLKSINDYNNGDIIVDIFNYQISKNGYIALNKGNYFWKNVIKDNIFASAIDTNDKEMLESIPIPIMIETPIIWNLIELFSQLGKVEQKYKISMKVPFIMEELDYYLHLKQRASTVLINHRISKIINGQFEKDVRGNFFFNRNDNRIELINTATGIKYFGILQVLSQNNWLNKDTVLILDEPEVHLHPKWQLEMAKIIVELVKNGVKIVVNSHSPYMIQALIKYARDEEEVIDKSNFYLTEKKDNYVKIKNVNNDLNQIFELLAKPMNEIFEL